MEINNENSRPNYKSNSIVELLQIIIIHLCISADISIARLSLLDILCMLEIKTSQLSSTVKNRSENVGKRCSNHSIWRRGRDGKRLYSFDELPKLSSLVRSEVELILTGWKHALAR